MGFITLPNMAIKVPTRNTRNWDAEVLATFTDIDAHDHTPGKGVQIPAAGIADGSIDGSKMLLENNEGLRQKDVGGTPRVIINLDDSDILRLQDAFGNTILRGAATPSAVNHFKITNAATGVDPVFATGGGDADRGMILADSNDNELLILESVAAAVNELTLANAPTGTGIDLKATGDDTDIDITLSPKGAGHAILGSLLFKGVDIFDVNENELLTFVSNASAVNNVSMSNEATGTGPLIAASGDDATIPLRLAGKGGDPVNLSGLNYPTADGTALQFMQTDGAGNLGFASVVIPPPENDFAFEESQVISSDSVIDFTDLDDANASYRFYLEGILPQNNASILFMRFSTNNGSSFLSTTGNYSSMADITKAVGSTESDVTRGSTTPVALVLTGEEPGFQVTNNANQEIHGLVQLINPFRASKRKHMSCNSSYNQSAGTIIHHDQVGICNTTSAVNAVRFQMSSGNMVSGTIRMHKIEGV